MDFVTTSISEFVPLGEFGFRLRGVDLVSEASQGSVLKYITIAIVRKPWRDIFTYYLSLITYYLLPITYYLLLITYYLLVIT